MKEQNRVVAILQFDYPDLEFRPPVFISPEGENSGLRYLFVKPYYYDFFKVGSEAMKWYKFVMCYVDKRSV
jgi:hypothetical protein